MRRFSALLFGLAVGASALLGVRAPVAHADSQWGLPTDEVVRRPMRTANPRSGFGTAAAETVWVGFKSSSSDVNKVGTGGLWDFDTSIAGTDSSQFWYFQTAPFASDAAVYNAPTLRPFWYFDYGNNIDRGDHNLWKARLLAGRAFRRTGLAGVWHSDNMSTVPDTSTAGGFSSNIVGSRSAWCGLRNSGDANAPTDPLTGNRYDGSLQYNDFRGGGAVRSGFPGYANQWDQLLYHDFPYSGSSISLSFRFRAQLSSLNTPAADVGGAGWYTPNPLSQANFVTNPADSFEVWVGQPQETGVYDTNRRWLSEVIDFTGAAGGPPVLLARYGANPTSKQVPLVGSDTTASLTIPASAGWAGGSVRVVFRVKTNRAEADNVAPVNAFNTVDGAVVLDDVNVGGNISGFESQSDIQPRALLSNTGVETVNNPSTTWITTGKPAGSYGHIRDAASLTYDDPCGSLDGSVGIRQCNLLGNVILQSDKDNGEVFHRESFNWAISPVVRLDAGTGGNPNLQGTAPPLRTSTSHVDLQYDFYSGNDDLSASVFFWYAVRFYATGLQDAQQQVNPKVSDWSPFNTPGIINLFGVPTCLVLDTDQDLIGTFPIPNTDSLQVGLENQTRCGRFGASANCGNTQGTYWDNLRLGFVAGAFAPVVKTDIWQLLADTFPFNSTATPGSADFDTTTALIKNGLNNGRTAGGEGVIEGDTLVYTSPFSGNNTRLDLVFRIQPGPGNYYWKGHKTSPLLKVPSAGTGAANIVVGDANDHSFWGSYIRDNGLVGSTNNHHASAGGADSSRWDPQTWNSARMDSAQANIFPIASRGIGLPTVDTWMGTYHESDPKFTELGNLRNLCFLVNQLGAANSNNICCSTSECLTKFADTYPPAGYPGGTVTQTRENTKIIPDGLLTPGSHVQYFVRRSSASAPTGANFLSPDTTIVAFQGRIGGNFDQLRYDSFDVLPDLWKRYGSGLACILYVDAADRRGAEPAMVGMLDSLGYGADNGADRGWRSVPTNVGNIDDPSGFVPANLGAMGLAYDKFDIRAGESEEGDRPGCRIVPSGIPANLTAIQCKNGPTVDMMDFYYNTTIWGSGDLDFGVGAMHDGVGNNQEQADDAGLVNQWLARGASGSQKAFWGSGDGLLDDLDDTGTGSFPVLKNSLGGLFIDNNYLTYSGIGPPEAVVFQPQTAAFHNARKYGMVNSCLNLLDVMDINGQAGAVRNGRYEDNSDRGLPDHANGPYYASVYRPSDGVTRFFSTLLDGFSFHRLRNWGGPSDPLTSAGPGALSNGNRARTEWMNDALTAFNLCARVNPAVSVGDVPGLNLNFVRGAFPNPAVAGAATVQFTLARPAKVTIRFYNVAGRLLHEQTIDGTSGLNSYRWNGVTSTGLRAASGVYFYRLSAPGIQFQNNSQRMVLLGQAN